MKRFWVCYLFDGKSQGKAMDGKDARTVAYELRQKYPGIQIESIRSIGGSTCVQKEFSYS